MTRSWKTGATRTGAPKTGALAALTLAVLAACGGGTQVGDAAAQFGQAFAASFRSTDRTEPAEPAVITFMQVADTNPDALLAMEPVNF